MSTTNKLPKNCYRQWFTEPIWKKLLSNGKRNDLWGRPPVVKLFIPDGNATWLLSSVNPQHAHMAFGLCDLGVGVPDLAYVNLNELESMHYDLNLPIERDPDVFLDKTLCAYTKLAEKLGHIAT